MGSASEPTPAPSWRQNEETPLVGSGASVATAGYMNLNAILFQNSPPGNPNAAEAEAWFASCMARVRASGRFGEFCTVTPEMAAILLRRNEHNRSLVASGVREWCEALRRGEWAVNGEAIIISDAGELNDGQHRLTAVIETGIPMQTLIVFGVSRDSRLSIDLGKKRTAAHVLGMDGISNGAMLAAAMKVIINLRSNGGTLDAHRSVAMIKTELADHPDLRLSLGATVKAGNQFKQSGALMVALHYSMAKRSREQADQFFDLLATGLGISSEKHPVARLRKRFTDELRNKRKLPRLEVAALTIKCWNAFRDGKDMGTLSWRSNGDAAEAFPRIK